jgi:hypothetical protein
MSSNDDLVNDVTDELYWDPKVDNSAIAVSADDGRITFAERSGASAKSVKQRPPRSECSAWSWWTTSSRCVY